MFKSGKRGVGAYVNKQTGGVRRTVTVRGPAASGSDLEGAAFLEQRRTNTMLRALVEVRTLLLGTMGADTGSVARILGEYDVREDVVPAAEDAEGQETGDAGEEHADRIEGAVDEEGGGE